MALALKLRDVMRRDVTHDDSIEHLILCSSFLVFDACPENPVAVWMVHWYKIRISRFFNCRLLSRHLGWRYECPFRN